MIAARNVPTDDVRRSLELTIRFGNEYLPDHADVISDVVNAGIAALDS